MRLKRFFYAFEHRGAEGVVGINHADLLVPQAIPHSVNLLARFVVVRRAHVHDPVAQRHVKGLRAGEQAHKRNFIFFREGKIFYGCGRAHEKSQGEDFIG